MINLVYKIGLVNFIALAWLLVLWVSYAKFAKRQAKLSASLSSVLHVHRINWMTRLLKRDIRVADAALLGNLERNVTFFASSSVLIIAGLITALTASEEIQSLIHAVNLIGETSLIEVEFKFLVLLIIFIYAFFTFTWSMRQFGFASVLVGAAPSSLDDSVSASDRRSFAIYGAKVIDQAGHSYNDGLRALYFAIAALSWFASTWIFMVASAVVVTVLYLREFHSKSLQALKQVENVETKIFKDDGDLYRHSRP